MSANRHTEWQIAFALRQAETGTHLLFKQIGEDEEEHLASLTSEQSPLARLGKRACCALRA